VLAKYPEVNTFFLERRILCMVCGEPFWGTIGELLEQKGFDEGGQDKIMNDCNEYIKQNGV
jgi:hypothetical protein